MFLPTTLFTVNLLNYESSISHGISFQGIFQIKDYEITDFAGRAFFGRAGGRRRVGGGGRAGERAGGGSVIIKIFNKLFICRCLL